MKATINGIIVEGTAEEIAKFVREFGTQTVSSGIVPPGNFVTAPYTPVSTLNQQAYQSANAPSPGGTL